MFISVRITLFGALRSQIGQQHLELKLKQGATVADALVACGLEDRVDIWALVNGQRTQRQVELDDGAQISFFQPVGGG